MTDSNQAFIRAYTRVSQESPTEPSAQEVPTPESSDDSWRLRLKLDETENQFIDRDEHAQQSPAKPHSADSFGPQTTEQAIPRPHVAFPSSIQLDVSTRRHSQIDGQAQLDNLRIDPGNNEHPSNELNIAQTESADSYPVEQAFPKFENSAERKPLSEFTPQPTVKSFRAAFEVPKFSWNPIYDQILSETQQHFDIVSERLILEAEAGRSIIAVVGTKHEAGATTAALCMARRLSAWGAHLGLIDASFESPGLAKSLGVSPLFGWEDALRGEQPLSEVLVQSLEDEIMLLPLAEATDRFENLNLTAGVQSAIGVGAVNDHNDVTLVDAGAPWSVPDGTRHFMRFLSRIGIRGVILVQSSEQTKTVDEANLTEHFQAAGIPIVGMIHNYSKQMN